MPSKYPMPDDFPDLSLPERTDKPPEPFRPDFSLPEKSEPFRPVSRESKWCEGDRVLAPWEPHFLYFGIVRELNDNQAFIEFGDGDSGWVLIEQIRPLVVQRGQKLLCRRRMSVMHFPASVVEVRGEEVCVRFDENGEEEWTKLGALRIPCQAIGPPANPTRVASHMHFAANLKLGDRVWAPWESGTLYAGTVEKLNDKEVHVLFDDGGTGWVLREQVAALDLPVGLPVLARWKMGPNYYPGTIAEVKGERLFIKYDDGDKEWTRPAALALPCQPVGPDARVTKPARLPTQAAGGGGSNAALGWIIPIGIGLLIAFARSGCR